MLLRPTVAWWVQYRSIPGAPPSYSGVVGAVPLHPRCSSVLQWRGGCSTAPSQVLLRPTVAWWVQYRSIPGAPPSYSGVVDAVALHPRCSSVLQWRGGCSTAPSQVLLRPTVAWWVQYRSIPGAPPSYSGVVGAVPLHPRCSSVLQWRGGCSTAPSQVLLRPTVAWWVQYRSIPGAPPSYSGVVGAVPLHPRCSSVLQWRGGCSSAPSQVLLRPTVAWWVQ